MKDKFIGSNRVISLFQYYNDVDILSKNKFHRVFEKARKLKHRKQAVMFRPQRLLRIIQYIAAKELVTVCNLCLELFAW